MAPPRLPPPPSQQPQTFVRAAAAAVAVLGPVRLAQLADRIAASPDPAPAGHDWEGLLLAGVAGPAARDATRVVLDARRAEAVPSEVAAAYLRGVGAGYAGRTAETT